MQDFAYLEKDQIYLDSACQSLRPTPVLAAMRTYYESHNSCGERVKYRWGQITDEKVEQTRAKVLKYLKLPQRDYLASFTANTTYGLNLILSQLKLSQFAKVITSNIEHNSPFLATIAFAKKHQIPREIIDRNPDGSLPLDTTDFAKSLVVVNCVSNIDGRQLANLKDLIKKVHKQGGTIIIDAAQALAHNADLLQKTDPDAICFSAHKMYAPSLGVIALRRTLLSQLDLSFIGGGMVDDVEASSYSLSSLKKSHAHTALEPGLQPYAEIIALGAALDWLESLPASATATLHAHAADLFSFLSSYPKVHLINQASTPTLSFHVENLDSHLLGKALSEEGIMARTGYFCCHYYLAHQQQLPPLIRLSLGHHIRPSDIGKTIDILSKVC